MACTVDHLGMRRRVLVRQDFRDARGVEHRAGERAVIRKLDLDWPTQEIVLTWDRNGTEETLYFGLNAKEGPRNNHMREYFEVEGEEPPKLTPRPPPQAPALSAEELETPVTDPERYADGLARVAALAARKRFTEAEEQVRVLLKAPDEHGGVLEGLADDMTTLAVAYVNDPAIHAWAREEALHLWYAWGSGATSGGEGAVRLLSIERAQERLAAAAAQVPTNH